LSQVGEQTRALTEVFEIEASQMKKRLLDAYQQHIEKERQALIVQAKIAENESILRALELEVTSAHLNGVQLGPHDWRHTPGRGNIFHKRPYVDWCARCSFQVIEGPSMGGLCPNNVLYGHPSWEEYKKQLGAPDSFVMERIAANSWLSC
jgi:hypothetical protein